MSKIIGVVILSLSAWTGANAGSLFHDAPNGWFGGDKIRRYTAPEIDPASAIAGLTMLAGGLAVIRGRRTKK